MASTGIASLRRAEIMIPAGRVTVNGTVAEIGQRIDPERDRVEVDGATLRRLLDLSAGDVACFHGDSTWERVPAIGFVTATRSAVRRTCEEVDHD